MKQTESRGIEFRMTKSQNFWMKMYVHSLEKGSRIKYQILTRNETFELFVSVCGHSNWITAKKETPNNTKVTFLFVCFRLNDFLLFSVDSSIKFHSNDKKFGSINLNPKNPLLLAFEKEKKIHYNKLHFIRHLSWYRHIGYRFTFWSQVIVFFSFFCCFSLELLHNDDEKRSFTIYFEKEEKTVNWKCFSYNECWIL